MSENLTDTIQADRALIEALTRTSCATEQLAKQMGEFSARLENLEQSMHTPPCRRLEAMDARVAALEKTSGRLSDLVWKIMAALATTAALAMWKVG